MTCTPDLESPTLAQGDQSESSEIQITEINALLNQLEEQHRDLKEEAELALMQLQETQSQLEEQAQENELLLLQLHQVQEELEHYYTEINALRNQLEEQHRDLKEEAELALKQLQETQSQLEEQAQENELLLLQLHQVQEELEHYFLETQRMSKAKENLKKRFESEKAMLANGYREARKEWSASKGKTGSRLAQAARKKLISSTYEN